MVSKIYGSKDLQYKIWNEKKLKKLTFSYIIETSRRIYNTAGKLGIHTATDFSIGFLKASFRDANAGNLNHYGSPS